MKIRETKKHSLMPSFVFFTCVLPHNACYQEAVMLYFYKCEYGYTFVYDYWIRTVNLG